MSNGNEHDQKFSANIEFDVAFRIVSIANASDLTSGMLVVRIRSITDARNG